MAISDLPMVAQMGSMMPQLLALLQHEPDPLQTTQKVRDISLPVLFIHGDRDEIVPVSQVVTAHEECNSGAKRLVCVARAHHNDLRVLAESEYFNEIGLLLA